METVANFNLAAVEPYVLLGAALGLALGVAAALRLHSSGALRRPSRLCTVVLKAEYLYIPAACTVGAALFAGAAGMAAVAWRYIGSEKADVSARAARAVDAALAEAEGRIRGAGLGDEAFEELARVAAHAALTETYRALAAEKGYEEALGPAQREARTLLRAFFDLEIDKIAADTGVTDAADLCAAARPRLRKALSEGAAVDAMRKASWEVFLPLCLYAAAAWLLLLAPCFLEKLFHRLFRRRGPPERPRKAAFPNRWIH
ncbi:MAG: hypothetical protein LBW85_11240 [Deltaproteobacteria bacterium]|jgi:hypothetical protein|nr:hypothetical protein [Deltaproteobacteria bacterium]